MYVYVEDSLKYKDNFLFSKDDLKYKLEGDIAMVSMDSSSTEVENVLL